MGDDKSNECARATDAVPRRRWRTCLLAAAFGVGLVLLLGVLFRDRILGPWRSEDKPFPPGVLADYVPADSEAVVAVNVRSLLESPAGRQLAPSLRQLVRQGERRFRWMGLLGIKPFDDLDSLQISFAPGSGGQPLWLARGRLDHSRFQIGPDKLQQKNVEHFRVLEYTDRSSKRTTLLAPVGDALVISDTAARVLAALKQARDPQPITVRNATLRELLQKVNRRQSLWLAASTENFGLLGEVDDFVLKLILRPLLAHTESVYGGIACEEDLRAELHFRTATEESAAKLEADLQAVRDLSRLLGGQGGKELRPLLQLLGTGQISREGQNVLLHCRLVADQLDG
ncbi:MAG TPA: hypothetical protein VH682_14810 [Gemmataceae bacterium]